MRVDEKCVRRKSASEEQSSDLYGGKRREELSAFQFLTHLKVYMVCLWELLLQNVLQMVSAIDTEINIIFRC